MSTVLNDFQIASIYDFIFHFRRFGLVKAPRLWSNSATHFFNVTTKMVAPTEENMLEY